jgi:predicted nucleotidyltransferase
MSTDNARSIVREYAEVIKKAGVPVEHIYLFGSHSDGAPTDDSDVDVCVVSPAFGEDSFSDALMLMRLRRSVSRSIEPHAYSPQDFDDPYNSIAVQVKKTGVQIV